jgi:hypothetical protein
MCRGRVRCLHSRGAFAIGRFGDACVRGGVDFAIVAI